jgi:hypothetical protein
VRSGLPGRYRRNSADDALGGAQWKTSRAQPQRYKKRNAAAGFFYLSAPAAPAGVLVAVRWKVIAAAAVARSSCGTWVEILPHRLILQVRIVV